MGGDVYCPLMLPANPTVAGDRRRRPFLVWLVSAVLAVLGAHAPYAYYLLATGAVDPSGSPRLALLVEAPVLFYAFSGATAVLNLACAIALFALRRVAYPLFAARFALLLAGIPLDALVPSAPWVDWSSPVAIFAKLSGVVGSLAIFGGLWAYAGRLRRRGLLA